MGGAALPPRPQGLGFRTVKWMTISPASIDALYFAYKNTDTGLFDPALKNAIAEVRKAYETLHYCRARNNPEMVVKGASERMYAHIPFRDLTLSNGDGEWPADSIFILPKSLLQSLFSFISLEDVFHFKAARKCIRSIPCENMQYVHKLSPIDSIYPLFYSVSNNRIKITSVSTGKISSKISRVFRLYPLLMKELCYLRLTSLKISFPYLITVMNSYNLIEKMSALKELILGEEDVWIVDGSYDHFAIHPRRALERTLNEILGILKSTNLKILRLKKFNLVGAQIAQALIGRITSDKLHKKYIQLLKQIPKLEELEIDGLDHELNFISQELPTLRIFNGTVINQPVESESRDAVNAIVGISDAEPLDKETNPQDKVIAMAGSQSIHPLDRETIAREQGASEIDSSGCFSIPQTCSTIIIDSSAATSSEPVTKPLETAPTQQPKERIHVQEHPSTGILQHLWSCISEIVACFCRLFQRINS